MVEVGGQRCTRARTGRGDDAERFSLLCPGNFPSKEKGVFLGRKRGKTVIHVFFQEKVIYCPAGTDQSAEQKLLFRKCKDI